MSREKKMMKNSMIYLVGNIGSRLLTFMFLPIYTRILTTKDYGSLDLIITSMFFFEAFFTFKIPESIYRWLIGNEVNKKEINSMTIISNILSVLLFSVFYIMFIPLISSEFRVLAYFYFITSISTPFYRQLLRGNKKIKEYSILGVVETFIFLITNLFCLLYLKLGIKSILISRIVANIIVILLVLKNQKIKSIQIKFFNMNLYKSWMKYSLPLIPSAICWWVMKFSDRFFIVKYIGYDSNGIYAVANQFPAIFMMINGIFYMVWQDSSIAAYNSEDRDKYYSEIFEYYYRFLFSLSLVLISASRLLTTIFVAGDFKVAWKYSLFLYLGAVFFGFSSFYATGFLSVKQTGGVFKSSLIGAIVNILVNLFFIKKYGLEIASISTFLGFFVMWIIRKRDTKEYFNIYIRKKLFIFLLCSNLILIMIQSYISVVLSNILIILIVLLGVIINKKIIMNVLRRKK